MTNEQRASIENGIWLCASHATIIDRDVVRFPVEALRAWKAQHERYVEQNIGEMRAREATPMLGGRAISHEAARIVAERGLVWEHRLFAQLVRDEIAKSRDEARDLKYAIETRAVQETDLPSLVDAIKRAMEDARGAIRGFTRLLNVSLPEAFGPSGQPGDAGQIEYVAHRVGDVYRRVIRWGLDWVHTRCSLEESETLLELLPQFMIQIQSALERIPADIERVYEEGCAALATDPDQEYVASLTITLSIPEDVAAAIVSEAERLWRIVH